MQSHFNLTILSEKYSVSSWKPKLWVFLYPEFQSRHATANKTILLITLIISFYYSCSSSFSSVLSSYFITFLLSVLVFVITNCSLCYCFAFISVIYYCNYMFFCVSTNILPKKRRKCLSGPRKLRTILANLLSWGKLSFF